MALRGKLKKTQVGSKAWQKAKKWEKKPPDVRAGTFAAQQKQKEKEGRQPDVTPEQARAGKAAAPSGYPIPYTEPTPTPPPTPSFISQVTEKVGAGLKAAGKTLVSKPKLSNIASAALMVAGGGIGKKVLGKGAGAKAAQAAAGKAPLGYETLLTGGQKVIVNTKTEKLTKSYFTRIGQGIVKNPKTTAGFLISLVGSYPFAGFIKEEALQTLGFGVNTALKNEDVEGAREALELQAEILDPNLWNTFLNGVPYANVVNNLKDFFEAAVKKMEIDTRATDKLEAGTEEQRESIETELAATAEREGFKGKGYLATFGGKDYYSKDTELEEGEKLSFSHTGIDGTDYYFKLK